MDKILEMLMQRWYSDEFSIEIAEDYLKKSDIKLEACDKILKALEKRLKESPKPSEVLAWEEVT